MIINSDVKEKVLILTLDNNKRKEVQIANLKSTMNDSDFAYVLVRNGSNEDVRVINEDGKIVSCLDNTETFYIMYLINHPIFGVCIACSEQIENRWEDSYYQFKNGAFIKVSRSR